MKLRYPSSGILSMTSLKCCIILTLLSVSNAVAAVQVTDDLGRNIALNTPAKRVIGLYGAYTEIFLGMRTTDYLVARTAADARYESIKPLPSVGTHMRPNLERIVGLAPDLVLQMGGRQEAIQSVYDLERLGITAAYFSITSFSDLFRVIEKLGLLIGQTDKANDLVRVMRERLEKVSMALSMIHDRPTVFFEVRSPSLLTVGNDSMVSEIIKMAGGSNCIKSDGKLVRINDEEVFELSPDYYLLQQGAMNKQPVSMTERPRLKYLPAVINGKWHVVDEHVFSRPGPANVDAVEKLAQILHPEAFQ